MVLIALLAIAVVCVIVGVITTEAVWLVISLVAGLLAAAVLVRSYRQLRTKRGAQASGVSDATSAGVASSRAPSSFADVPPVAAQPAPAQAVPVASPPDADAASEVLVVDGEPEFHVDGCASIATASVIPIPRDQAVEDGFTACRTCDPGAARSVSTPAAQPTAAVTMSKSAPPVTASTQVWVADGHPEYHVQGCRALRDFEAIAVRHDQAVEDGFTPCTLCSPEAAVVTQSEQTVSAAPFLPITNDREASRVADAQVWVVDGSPEYHREVCHELTGREAEPIPHDQAVEDGFAECTVCTPESAQAPASPVDDHDAAGAGDGAQVWVVDGFPDYHREGCSVTNGLSAEPVPHAQAVEDGFAECTVCTPKHEAALSASAVDASTDRDAWVVDGHPDYHVDTCAELERLGGGEPVPFNQAVEDGFCPCAVCHPQSAPSATSGEPVATVVPAAPQSGHPDEVMVVDGYPDYHRAGCATLDGRNDEPVPYDQAVEDGFSPCQICSPDGQAEHAAPIEFAPEPVAPAAGPKTSDHPDEVMVVDGYPEYHRAGCATLEGLEDEAVPYDQAVEDGFSPCTVCQPGGVQPAAPRVIDHADEAAGEPEPEAAEHEAVQPEVGAKVAPEPATAPGEAGPAAAPASGTHVWVIDGRPRFHEQDCLIIKGQASNATLKDEAIADGFLPCSLCQR